MTVLELTNVSKSYGEGSAKVTALARVSLSVAPGTMVAVMGPSGSGKSTLLTIAGGLEEPDEGEVLVAGAPLSGMSRNDRARLRRRAIGYVFQDYNLLAGLTAAENVGSSWLTSPPGPWTRRTARRSWSLSTPPANGASPPSSSPTTRTSPHGPAGSSPSATVTSSARPATNPSLTATCARRRTDDHEST